MTIQDPRLRRIHETQSCPDLPKAVVKAAAKLTRLLLAARSWSDVGVITRVAELATGQFAAPVHGRWGIVFAWDEQHDRAVELELRRL